jgi:hypothetical protein
MYKLARAGSGTRFVFLMHLLFSSTALVCLFSASLCLAQTAPKATAEPELTWYDAATLDWQPEGKAWLGDARQRFFDRLPTAAEATVPPAVWNLSRDSAGMVLRFKTNAESIWIHYKLKGERLALAHMPATGVSGVDLYARDESDAGNWKWVQVTRPNSVETKALLVSGLRPGSREYAAYLPLYNGVESIAFGAAPESEFEPLAPRQDPPIVFYGTSITHGASASRPGMVHTAILGRRLDRPVVNLGFSGNGKMDGSVGEFLTRTQAAVFVIDCLPNMNAEQVSERTIPLVKQLRTAHPQTPIVLVEDRRFTNSWITPAKAEFHDLNHAALRASYDALIKDGVKNLHYIPGDALYGTDTEGATDASHASDLGFMRQADIFEPMLRALLP